MENYNQTASTLFWPERISSHNKPTQSEALGGQAEIPPILPSTGLSFQLGSTSSTYRNLPGS